MENTTLTTKVVFMLTTSEYPTPQIIDIMDVDVAWHVDMVAYASQYAFENGHVAYSHTESNYGRTVTIEAESMANGKLQQWTITKSQPAHFNGNVELNESSRKCLELALAYKI